MLLLCEAQLLLLLLLLFKLILKIDQRWLAHAWLPLVMLLLNFEYLLLLSYLLDGE